MSIQSRKQQHVEITLTRNVEHRNPSGLDRWEFVYNALPELDFADIDTSVSFLGHRLHLPLIVTGMTGGYPDAERINADIADACCELGIAMGVGSMRAALESDIADPSFGVVHSRSHRIPIIANIGAVQAVRWHRAGTLESMIHRAIELVGASALAVHLNPLQELAQPEGEPEFRGVTEVIAWLVRHSPVPLLVKEVGAGISNGVAQRLREVGVTMIDVAGTGGTSWAGVEILRHSDPTGVEHLWDVGIPTSEALVQCRGIVPTLIASGGIRNGIDVAKTIALGATLAGGARPILQAQNNGGTTAILHLVRDWELQLRQMMFLVGSGSIGHLQSSENIACKH